MAAKNIGTLFAWMQGEGKMTWLARAYLKRHRSSRGRWRLDLMSILDERNVPIMTFPQHSNAQELYQSKGLPDHGRSIRLLHIHGPDYSKLDGGPLHGNITIADLDSGPSFTSLSYVWAQQPSKTLGQCFILCEGASIEVTANCYLALVHLRQQLQAFTVWIDAICINQADHREKAQQIPLLGEIYACSRAVHIWLGEGSAATDRAIAYLDNAGFKDYLYSNGDPNEAVLDQPRLWRAAWVAMTSFVRQSQHPFPFLNRDPRSWWPASLKNIYPPPKTGFASYEDIGDLLTREWTRRIWTYQEIMLARNPTIVCGTAHIPWPRFALSILFLDHIQPHRLANLGTQTAIAIKVWKKIVLTRERLGQETDGFVTSPDTPNTPSSLLRSRSNAGVQKSRICSEKKSASFDLATYRTFLFDVFIRSLAIGHGLVTIAYLSLANLATSVIVFTYHTDRAGKRGIYVYLTVSIVAFFILFPGYCIMMYSYFYTKMFNMPTRNLWLQTMEDDAVDDFMNAIITRNAKERKDMAFGLQSVLEIKLGRTLPPPDYSKPLTCIYKDLTTDLLQATGHLHFLLPGAEKGLPGEPSWIPDWSAEFTTYWLRPFMRFTSTKENWIARTFFETNACIFCTERRTPLWALEGSQNSKLRIMAHTLCTITDTFQLRQTGPHFEASEMDLHIQNIEILQGLFKYKMALRRLGRMLEACYFINHLNFPRLPEDINPDHLRVYWSFIWDSKRVGARKTMELWTRPGIKTRHSLPYGLSLPLFISVSGHEMLRIHVAICNELVRTRRKFFSSVSFEPRGDGQTKRTFGICTNKAEVGDKVVLVPGLPSLLVLRESQGSSSATLVSPAVSFEYVPQIVKDRVSHGGKRCSMEVLEPFTLT